MRLCGFLFQAEPFLSGLLDFVLPPATSVSPTWERFPGRVIPKMHLPAGITWLLQGKGEARATPLPSDRTASLAQEKPNMERVGSKSHPFSQDGASESSASLPSWIPFLFTACPSLGFFKEFFFFFFFFSSIG